MWQSCYRTEETRSAILRTAASELHLHLPPAAGVPDINLRRLHRYKTLIRHDAHQVLDRPHPHSLHDASLYGRLFWSQFRLGLHQKNRDPSSCKDSLTSVYSRFPWESTMIRFLSSAHSPEFLTRI